MRSRIAPGDGIFPLEVKAAENLHAKSLRVYSGKFSPPRCFRASLSPCRKESWITNLPLHAISRLAGEMAGEGGERT